ncbi:hypothetical protein RirG_165020 [Rhizophagus irregularis DAOM 197198w]|uniref:Uncharacterized protein n=6 Tax=Rhizophagus irregularis TaxID=588596 RepID=A0A015KQN4_RHIIW|nr:hypothetical protein RirG_165020 [Rhizophagus irregularis DAOM 197198w]
METIKKKLYGIWGSGEYCGERTYRLKCWNALQRVFPNNQNYCIELTPFYVEMAQQSQPQQLDFAVLNQNTNILIQAVGNITQQLTNLQNLPALNAGQLNAIQNTQHQMQNTQHQMQTTQRQMQRQMQTTQHQMQINQRQMQTQLRRIQNSINNFTNNVRVIDAQSLARTRNSSVQSVREAITPLPNANNQMPNNFPRNTLELLRLTVHKIDVFLTFYNLPRNGSVLVKRERLSKFLGLKLI